MTPITACSNRAAPTKNQVTFNKMCPSIKAWSCRCSQRPFLQRQGQNMQHAAVSCKYRDRRDMSSRSSGSSRTTCCLAEQARLWPRSSSRGDGWPCRWSAWGRSNSMGRGSSSWGWCWERLRADLWATCSMAWGRMRRTQRGIELWNFRRPSKFTIRRYSRWLWEVWTSGGRPCKYKKQKQLQKEHSKLSKRSRDDKRSSKE